MPRTPENAFWLAAVAAWVAQHEQDERERSRLLAEAPAGDE